ncbi:MAG: SDR family NAD(P)-dependent oxidoreductase [Phycisphaerae bacterium]|nr:SDR family NAD(P)-dependent oxidoreductase [Phycisphaerae bacterium]
MSPLAGKRVLVTGADGFIGSHLVETLVGEGCKVRAFCYYNSRQSWGWLEQTPPQILSELEVVLGDIRDPDSVLSAVRGCQMVFHLAALIGIPYSYQCPESYIDTNIKGTLHILRAGRDCRVERILVTSTSEVYGTAQYVPIDEKHPLQGQSPYSASKIGADRLAESFWRSFGTPVVIVRPFNTYGPRQSARAVIPTIITQLLAGQRQIRLGDLTPRRDLNFVCDVCEAFAAVARSDSAIGQEINIASGQEIAIRDLAGKIIEQIEPSAEIETDDERIRPRTSEVQRLLGCNRRIRELTGWSPRHSLEEGLSLTIEWFRQNPDFYKPGLYQV